MYNVRAPDTGVTLRYLSECVCVCARVCVIVRYSVCVMVNREALRCVVCVLARYSDKRCGGQRETERGTERGTERETERKTERVTSQIN
jgi:hypothetical protein